MIDPGHKGVRHMPSLRVDPKRSGVVVSELAHHPAQVPAGEEAELRGERRAASSWPRNVSMRWASPMRGRPPRSAPFEQPQGAVRDPAGGAPRLVGLLLAVGVSLGRRRHEDRDTPLGQSPGAAARRVNPEHPRSAPSGSSGRTRRTRSTRRRRPALRAIRGDLNEMIDANSARVAALTDRVPTLPSRSKCSAPPRPPTSHRPISSSR